MADDEQPRFTARRVDPPEPSVPMMPPAGWYPDPEMPGTQRYWDGARWSEHVAPAESPSSGSAPQLLIALVLAGAAIGFIMAMQSASLLTGTGVIWTGVAVAVGAAVVAQVVKAIPTWVRVVCILAAVVAGMNAISVESQLNDRREELNEILQ